MRAWQSRSMTSTTVGGLHVGRLKCFLSEWHRLREANTLVRRLEQFFGQAHPLFTAARIECPRQPQIDAGKLAIVLPRVAAALRRGGSSSIIINPWAASGLARGETRNAAVLASLWSATLCGPAGSRFLREFLARVERPDQLLPDAVELAGGYVVRTEHCPAGDAADRVDIVVESARHVVGIEVKINAGEGDRQLERYVEALDRSARRLGKRSHVILLAPFRPSRADVVGSDWAVVRAAAEASMPDRRSERSFAHHLIASFASHVRSF